MRRPDRLRMRAITLAQKGSLSRAEIAAKLEISRSTLQKWLALYEKAGSRGLKRKRKLGSPRSLTHDEQALILSRIVCIPPRNVRRDGDSKLQGLTWTWRKAQELVFEQLERRPTRTTVVRYLANWNLWPSIPNLDEQFAEARRQLPPDNSLGFGSTRRRVGLVCAQPYALPFKVDLSRTNLTRRSSRRKDFTILTAMFGRSDRCFAVMSGAYSLDMVRSFADFLEFDHCYRDDLYLISPHHRSRRRPIPFSGHDSIVLHHQRLRQWQRENAKANSDETWDHGESVDQDLVDEE